MSCIKISYERDDDGRLIEEKQVHLDSEGNVDFTIIKELIMINNFNDNDDEPFSITN